MASKKAATADEAPAGKKSKKSAIIVGLLCVGLAGGGYVLGGQGAASGDQAEAAATTTTIELIQKRGCATTSTDEAPATVVDLEPLSINLAEGHYLRISVSLGLCDDVVLAEGEEFMSAPARDLIVSSLSGLSFAELADDAGRAEVKERLIDEIVEAYPGEVYEIYFVEFVMQ